MSFHTEPNGLNALCKWPWEWERKCKCGNSLRNVKLLAVISHSFNSQSAVLKKLTTGPSDLAMQNVFENVRT